MYEYIYKKYGEYPMGFTTMSIYGKSIQYDRLKQLKFLGFTKGYSIHNISSKIFTYCKEFLRENNIKIPSNSLWLIHKTLDILNIPKDEFLKSNKKGVYFGYTHTKSKLFLNNSIDTIPNPILETKNIYEIFDWWKNRWATQRYTHLQKNNLLKMEEDSIKEWNV